MTAGLVALEPYLLEAVWGGRELQRRFGKAAPPDRPVGEAWEISCVPGRECRAAGSTTTLAELVRAAPARFLENGAPRFPLLVKLLSTAQLLSVQVHPNDRQAAEFEGSFGGKHEAWVVLDAAPGAELFVGLREGVGVDDLFRAVGAGDPAAVRALMRSIRPEAGDVFEIAPGVVHAPGPGLVLYEVQQPTDWTYRVYDWGRVGLDGRPRALHAEKARAVIDATIRPEAVRIPAVPGLETRLLATPWFDLRRLRVDGDVALEAGGLALVTCVGGSGTARADQDPPVPLAAGRSCVAARDAKNVRFAGSALDLLIARPAPRHVGA